MSGGEEGAKIGSSSGKRSAIEIGCRPKQRRTQITFLFAISNTKRVAFSAVQRSFEMGATTIRIRRASHEALKEMAEMTGKSLQDLLDEAIEDRRRRLYLEGADADYASLTRDGKALASWTKEIMEWDATDLNGFEET